MNASMMCQLSGLANAPLVPIQRVSYGGRSESSRTDLDQSTEASTRKDFDLVVNRDEERSEEDDFWSAWPWSRHISHQTSQTTGHLPARFTDLNDFDWDPASLEYFNYSSANAPSICILLASMVVLLVILGDDD
ncbi:hypothetical protein OESDEN_08483 [Oesophagostomum dentatum]|uniref:Uncharacterized protein n=1 Tax=Oesophagostomum dentatum TaxID=61180 RepID=A0A0B1T2B5_OESDE|nr:hypothetical protein OESDEN_08483 [Oesophagostomum dentatum]